MAKTKDEIIQEAVNCLEDIVTECYNERVRQGNHHLEYIEQTTRGYVKHLKKLIEEEKRATIEKAFFGDLNSGSFEDESYGNDYDSGPGGYSPVD